ncbi:MAG: hypothetical protein JKY65_26895 [Planctomycetes bacterium]|nr:hypothetical protein [Planctomycetota bacterium]
MEAPVDLFALSGDGKSQLVARAGASLPCEVRLVFATSQAGQTELALDLAEGERTFARARFELPRGLPANCWIPVYVRVESDLRVSAEARENLRRIRIEGVFESLGEAEYYRV